MPMTRTEILDNVAALVATHAAAQAALADIVASLRLDGCSWDRIAKQLDMGPEEAEARYGSPDHVVPRPLGWMPGDPD